MTDLQPGGSGAGSTVEDQWIDWISVHAVECVESDHERCAWDATRADLEAARGEIERLTRESSARARLATEWQLKNDALRAELERVRQADARGLEIATETGQKFHDDLAQARGEIEQIRGQFSEYVHGAETDLAQARARIAVLGRVDEAAREYSYNGHVPPCRVEYRHCTCGYTDLLHTLDAAQAAQQPQPASETTAALGDLQSPGPRQDAPTQ